MSKDTSTASPTTWIDAYGVAWYGCKDGNDIPADMRRKARRRGTTGMPRPRPVPRRVNVSPPRNSIRRPTKWVNEWGVPMYGCQDGNDIPADERRMSRTTRNVLIGAASGFFAGLALATARDRIPLDEGEASDFGLDFGGD